MDTAAQRTAPFSTTIPAVVAAGVYAAAALLWGVAGSWLPGGRWLAVHLFTLGVLTNVVLAFTEHFGRTLTHAPSAAPRWHVPVANLGAVLVLVGLPGGSRGAIATGATVLTGVVFASYVRLRRLRRAALGARFAWIVRSYERAHGAFIHGAVLGLLLGTGLLPGQWYGGARLAHLHVNVLGWGGITLLATLVFFGPTIVRTRIVAGADERAARALRHGATGLTVGVLLLLATGVGGTAAGVLRVAAAVGLAAFAAAGTIVCVDVVTAARRAGPTALRAPVLALATWLPVALWGDVAMVATGGWRWLDVVGLAVFIGVLLQAVVAALTYVAPMLRSGDAARRGVLRERLERAATVRAVAFNLGAAAVVVAAALRGAAGSVLARGGAVAVVATVLWLVAAAAVPVRARRPAA